MLTQSDLEEARKLYQESPPHVQSRKQTQRLGQLVDFAEKIFSMPFHVRDAAVQWDLTKDIGSSSAVGEWFLEYVLPHITIDALLQERT